MIWEALQIAYNAYFDREDEDGNPYFLHAVYISEFVDTTEEKIVAILHKVIEKTDITIDMIEQRGFSEKTIVALKTITRNEGEAYNDYIARVNENEIARKVKIEELKHGIAILEIKGANQERLKRRMDALAFLENHLDFWDGKMQEEEQD